MPIAAPSANLFTRPSATNATHVLEDLDGCVDIIIDGGLADIGLESTVVDMTRQTPAILRPGGIGLERLMPILPGVRFAPQYIMAEGPNDASASPGMLTKHYSPRAPLLLFSGHDATRVRTRMTQVGEQLAGKGDKVAALTLVEDDVVFRRCGLVTYQLGAIDNLAQVASRLFDGMRTLDRMGVAAILARSYERQGIGLALWDRLYRAAEGRVIEVS